MTFEEQFPSLATRGRKVSKMNIKEMGDNLIMYIRKHEPKEVFIDVTGMGNVFYDYVKEALKGSPTKLVMVHGIGRTDDMAYRRVKE